MLYGRGTTWRVACAPIRSILVTRSPVGREGKNARAEPRSGQHHHCRDFRRGKEGTLPADERHRARCRRPGEGVPETGWRLDASLRGLLRQGLRLAGAGATVEARIAEGQ